MKQVLSKKQIVGGFVLALVVILCIVFYFKNVSKLRENNISFDKISETQNSTTKEDLATNEAKPSAVITANGDSFNKAIKNAQDSYLAKRYDESLNYYNQALKYLNSDLAYSGMFNVYSAQKDWVRAQSVLDKAIALNPLNTDYWKWKLTILDQQTNTSFAELKKIYEEGISKSLPRSRINLVIHFARIAEGNGQKTEAINTWEYAIKLYPDNSASYQTEIDRLKSL